MVTKLSKTERKVLDILGRVMYLTQGQLEQWGVPQYAVSRMLPRLEKGGLIRVLRDYRPHVICITRRGAHVVDRSLPSGKSYTSWPVMAHRCRRNAVELSLRKRFPRFTFYSRKYAYAKGLNPSRGEHGGVDDAGRHYLVILDDYLMAPSRIVHSWVRRHSPNRAYYDEHIGQTWADIADHLIVVTTEDAQVERHRALLKKCDAARDMLLSGDAPSVIQHRLGMKNVVSVERYSSVPAGTEVLRTDSIWAVH